MKHLTPLTRLALREAARLAAMIIAGLTTIQSAHGALLHHWDFNAANDPIDGANTTLVANLVGDFVLKIGHIVKDAGECCIVLPVNHLNMTPQLHTIGTAFDTRRRVLGAS